MLTQLQCRWLNLTHFYIIHIVLVPLWLLDLLESYETEVEKIFVRDFMILTK